jgi:aspartate/methionine/tyrosine aminotransferase
MEKIMSINTFKLEEYLAKYEFCSPYLLCCSDAESFSMQELLAMATLEQKELWDNLSLGYTTVSGLEILREQIARSLYPTLSLNNILCFAGAQDAIFCALHTICEPGDHVIVLTPAYQSLLEIPALKNASVSAVALRKENNWRIDIHEIKKTLQSTTKCIVINFPHNPTGQVITQDELKDLVSLCREHDIWLFSDEVYRLLGTPYTPWALPAAEVYKKAISVGVMSKAFGLAGLRTGFIACQDKAILAKIERLKHYTSICNSAPSEILSLIALTNKNKILERNNKIVLENLRLLDKFMQEYSHLFGWIRPQGGCVGFINYKQQESVDEFSKRLLEKTGVLLMPASLFDHKSNYFRIGFGRKNMPKALEKLREFLLL